MLALGSSAGSATINVSARDDSSSLLPIGERQVREFPGTARQSTATIEVSTLDAAVSGSLARPCLLKIDVQGLELEVLKGGRATLGQVDEALVECSFVELYEGQALADEVIAFMLDFDLRLAGSTGPSLGRRHAAPGRFPLPARRTLDQWLPPGQRCPSATRSHGASLSKRRSSNG